MSKLKVQTILEDNDFLSKKYKNFQKSVDNISLNIRVRYTIMIGIFVILLIAYFFFVYAIFWNEEYNILKIQPTRHPHLEKEYVNEFIEKEEDKKSVPFFETYLKRKKPKKKVFSEFIFDSNINSNNNNNNEEDFKDYICKNTKQGDIYITDSKGYFCKVKQVKKNLCCNIKSSNQYDCKYCNKEKKCCLVYENCVSCCMDISNRRNLRDLYISYLESNFDLFINVKLVFDFCSLKCRTESKSLLNERFYVSENKYCYGKNLGN